MIYPDRNYKIYLLFKNSDKRNEILDEKEANEWLFMYKGNQINESDDISTKFDFSNPTKFFKRNSNSMKILVDGAYIKSNYDIDNENTKQFTLSFYYKIPKDILLNDVFYKKDNKIHGMSWNDNKNIINLYDYKDYTLGRYYNNKCIYIKYCDVEHRIFFDYENYDGDTFLYFSMTLDEDSNLRIFLNGICYLKKNIINPDFKFNNIVLGNYKTNFSKPDIMLNGPIVEYDEISICDSCIYKEEFNENIYYPTNENYPEMGERKDDLVDKELLKTTIRINKPPIYYNPYSSKMQKNSFDEINTL